MSQAKELLKILMLKQSEKNLELADEIVQIYKEGYIDLLKELDSKLKNSSFYITLSEKSLKIHSSSIDNRDIEDGLTIFANFAYRNSILYSISEDGERVTLSPPSS